MSISRKERLFYLIESAIRANVYIVDGKKFDLKVDRYIVSHPHTEGDSQLALILFIGISDYYGLKERDIMDKLNIEFREEFRYKLTKFKALTKETANPTEYQKKYMRKKSLIINYINQYENRNV
jgi:hypothetical protein